MKTILSGVIASVMLTGVALAGSSQGGSYGAHLPIGVEFTGAPEKRSTYRVPMPTRNPCQGDIQPLACGAVPQSGYQPFPAVALTAEELAFQQAVNAAWRRQQWEGIRSEAYRTGHWGNGVLPVEYGHAFWGFMSRGAIGASEGGSD